MRSYEKFKTEAMRLTSITCDRCGTELYRAPNQPYWNLGYGLHYPRSRFELCEGCYGEIVCVIEALLGEPRVERSITPYEATQVLAESRDAPTTETAAQSNQDVDSSNVEDVAAVEEES